MLEIIFIIMLTRRNGRVCREKNIRPVGYQVLTVLLWIALEFIGGIIGALVAQGETLVAYLFALLGAALGALTSYLIVNSLDPKIQISETLDSDFTKAV